jgi:hypothetical protein
MPSHRDMPEGWQAHARRRSDEAAQAVERAREARAATAPVGLDELARRRRRRLQAQDAARDDTSVPPPPPPYSAA